MSIQTEEHNIAMFKSVLNEVHIEDATADVIQAIMEKETNTFTRENNIYTLDRALSLDEERRAWHTIEMDRDEGNDKGYNLFLSCIDDKGVENVNHVLKEWNVSLSHLLSYHTYKTGKIQVGDGSERKLFKLLLKDGLLTQKEMDRLNVARVNASKAYLCVSRNPVDYIFCSARQSFSSCLDATKDNSYFAGLVALALDPNRVFIFMTNSKEPLQERFRDKDFYYYKYISRCWALWLDPRNIHNDDVEYKKELMLGLVKSYGANVDLHNKIKSVGYNALHMGEIEDDIPSMFPFQPPVRPDGGRAMIYLDDYGYWSDGQDWYYYPGYGNNCHGVHHCIDCGRRIVGDNVRWSNNQPMCRRCFEKVFFICTMCGGSYVIEGAFKTPEGEDICKHCFESNFVVCDVCRTIIPTKKAVEAPNDKRYCANCFDELYTNCASCDEVAARKEAVNVDDGRWYCRLCHEVILDMNSRGLGDIQKPLFQNV